MNDEIHRKLMQSPAFAAELDAARDEGERVLLFSRLRYIAAQEGFKPGWAAHFYKSLYGTWPDRGWEDVAPIEPSPELIQLVERRQRNWKNRAMQKFKEERRAKDERERGVEDSETAGALYEGDEGDDRVCGDGRMSGMEEQDECSGELCPSDE